jgi:MFS superfamily sulfate permease-like transporter
VQAGAQSRASAILHGAWLLMFVALLGWLLTMIPTACLAAILVYTGYKLVNPKSIAKLWQYGRGEVAIYLATVVTIVVKDLLTGVLLGIALASARLLYTFSHLQVRVEKPAPGKTVLHLTGTATFLRLPKLAAELEKIPPAEELHVDFDQLDYIDHACIDLLMNWEKSHTASGGRLVIDWENLQAIFRRENGSGATVLAGAAPPNGHSAARESTARRD